MAKTAKLKKRRNFSPFKGASRILTPRLETTLHSRAARRAVSPSIDLDKSLRPTPHADATANTSKTVSKPHVLSVQSAGVIKKSKSKPMKRQQRLRQLKGVSRAEDALDKLDLKVQRSVGKEKKVNERRKGWDEINGGKKKRGGFEALGHDEEGKKEREWVSDEEMPEMEIGVEDSVVLPDISGEVKEVVVPESIPLPVATVEDEML